ncbi:MAG: gliding motility-associated C-terminal domain-containing protein [Bacteroidia bacterium]
MMRVLKILISLFLLLVINHAKSQVIGLSVQSRVNETCYLDSNGSISLSVSNGTPPYTYICNSDTQSSPVFSGLPGGVYALKVIDSLGGTDTLTTHIVSAKEMELFVSKQDATCGYSQDGSSKLDSVLNNLGSYSVSWYSEGVLLSTNPQLGNIIHGSYRLSLTDSLGCSVDTIIFIGYTDSIEITLTKTDVSCYGDQNGEITLKVQSKYTALELNWIGPDSFSSQQYNLNGLKPGAYTVYISDSIGTCTSEAKVNILQPDSLIAKGAINKHVSCFGGNDATINSSISGGNKPYSIQWGIENSTIATSNITNGIAGEYTLIVIDGNGCEDTDTLIISQPTKLTVSVTKTDNICFGESLGTIKLNTSGGIGSYVFQWSDGVKTRDRLNLGNGSYTVIIKDSNLCQLVKTIQVNSPAELQSSVNSVDLNCFKSNDGEIRVYPSGGTYPWKVNINGPKNYKLNASIAKKLAAGDYSIVVEDSKGCFDSSEVKLKQPDSLELVLTDFDPKCFGEKGSASATIKGGTTPYGYNWTDKVGKVLSGSSVVFNLNDGKHYLTIVDAKTCSLSDSFHINSPKELEFTIKSKTDNLCFDDSTGTIELQAKGGITPYSYRLNANGFVSTDKFIDLPSSSYLVTLRDKNGCQDSLNVNIKASDTLPPSLVLRKQPSFYLNSTGSFVLDVSMIDSSSFDNCGGVKLELGQSSFNCSNLGTNVLQIKGTDSLGNTTSMNSSFSLKDTISPRTLVKSSKAYLNAKGLAIFNANQFNNGTSDNCSLKSIHVNIDTVACSLLGKNQVLFTATDISGNTHSQKSHAYVIDTVKPIIKYQNLDLYLNANGTVKLDTSMVDKGSFDNCKITKRLLSKTNFGCTDLGTNSVLYTIIDQSGNTSVQTIRINVIDTIAPVIRSKSINAYLNRFGVCQISVNDIENGTTDNCKVSSKSLNKYVFSCDDLGTNNITYTVVDVSGNTSSDIVSLTVIDTIKPVSKLRTAAAYLDKNGFAKIYLSDVNNGIDDNCSIGSITFSKDQFFCSDLGRNTIYLNITDNSGNNTVDSTLVFVRDTISPNLRSRNKVAYLDSVGKLKIPMDYFDDGSFDNCAIKSYKLSKSEFDCSSVGTNTIIYQLRDSSENLSLSLVELTLQDTSKPILYVEDLNVYLDEDGFGTISVNQFLSKCYDNCGIKEIYFSDSIFDCDDIGTNILQFSAIDISGNRSQRSFRVYVKDTIAPTFTTSTTTIYIDTSGFANLEWVEVVDTIVENCQDYILNLSPVQFGTSDIGENYVTISLVDNSGNKSIQKIEKVIVLPGDFDRDSIPDFIESGYDFDLDGVPNYRDKDSDNDGILDVDENLGLSILLDLDRDGRYNIYDLDTDGDGLNDISEVNGFDPDMDGLIGLGRVLVNNSGIPILANESKGYVKVDTDNDLIWDFQDIDSDNDKIEDRIENFKPNEIVDTDADGIPDYRDLDSDADRISDVVETNADFDGDGLGNYIDLDSDNDGIQDSIETVDDVDLDGNGSWLDLDSDGDLIFDADEGSDDFDLDGLGNWKDQDADNDGIKDIIELADDIDLDGIPNFIDLDSDADGIPDGIEAFPMSNGLPADTDTDGVPDFIDQDSDNDEIFDYLEGFPNIPDTDGDGLPDYRDDDSDNDGILDKDESQGDRDGDGLSDAVDSDSDGDGIPDFIETSIDSDGDGVPNYLDLDSDNDGFNDIWEAGGDDTSGRGITTHLVLNPPDTDGDGILDPYDLDSDGDGITDIYESFYNFIDDNNDGRQDGPDTDGDGIVDYFDGYNGVYGDYYDYKPFDFDYDGKPDFQDFDSDDDGILDKIEGTEDFDFDFYPNYLDEDSDDDQILDKNETSDDIDFDGSGNFIDLDSDGDLIFDEIETEADFDGDGIPNYLDLDSDNDELSDKLEGDIDADGNTLKDYIDPTTFISEIFTPNGDGINDTLIVKGLTNFPDSELVIYNQFGQVVYRSNGGYKNNWDGVSSLISGGDNGLPEGIYYYILEHRNLNDPSLKRKPNKGNFYLKP